jgi:curved DNA-binding protein CbpA
MTADLYKVLGVPNDADRATVRRAYRRASKHAHPDVPGGSAKRFALVKQAHDTLTDEARRRHYDQTGEIDEKPPDNKQAEALQCLAAAFEAVLAECESARKKPETVDVAERMRAWIKGHLSEGRRHIAHIESLIAENDAIGARFNDELMPQIISGRAAMLRTKIETIRRNHQTGEEALQLLEPVSFRVDPAPPPSLHGPGYFNLLAQLGG